ncbi:Ppx/GppA family phosphatase [Romeria aff. gracilis LEGE 07310]|uniref:Ppx/GppA family phosphatase n=1 Tax=Vasconcelosia minhoensis LEGE 07310 TaxID=915328 RepID=A0A8J7AJA5_9CYAN|nr:Ppx/GppA phosphatase family protein [Romeria gracilis]MBE9079994.1 Ppx/GppA family phosphatase [Romeria aff. gracilis LEGE 07310]
MKLAAIDIGTNSIHMVIVEVRGRRSFDLIDREKEMVKLGAGVFATQRLSDRAYQEGLETISRYVQLADQVGVDEIITAATSAIREAQNGEAFLSQVVKQTGLSPRIISGTEEARLIFLAVRNAIALKDGNALVLDIGGGSTEVAVGSREDFHFGYSLPLGVLRLLDMFEDKGPVGAEARGVLEAHIQMLARDSLDQAQQLGFTQVIGTSGTIRTLGEAAHLAADGDSLRSLNAEVVQISDIEDITEQLLDLKLEKRPKIEGISEKRADAIHLGGVLLVQLLNMAGVEKLTLCEASLREGLLLDYLERHVQPGGFSAATSLRHRLVAQLSQRFSSDWPQKKHIASLAQQIFDQTQPLHELGPFEREILEHAACLYDIGQYIAFRRHHKHGRYIIKNTELRGFTDEEILLIGHVVRYHRKAKPKKKHKKFKRLTHRQRRIVRILSGILRLAVRLDKTRNQRVEQVTCQSNEETLKLAVSGEGSLELEIWAAMRDREVLADALARKIKIYRGQAEAAQASPDSELR